jgi:hypothetical protein
MIHNTTHQERSTRPHRATATTRWAARIISGILLLAVLAAAWRSPQPDAAATVIVWGALVEVMLLASPVCHLHYFCLSTPLMAGLIAATWKNQSRPRLGIPLSVLIALNVAANTVPHFVGMEVWRDVGIAGYAAVGLLLTALVVLLRWHDATDPAQSSRQVTAAA